MNVIKCTVWDVWCRRIWRGMIAAVPRAGDLIMIDDSGCAEAVKTVTWDMNQRSVSLTIRTSYDRDNPEYDEVA